MSRPERGYGVSVSEFLQADPDAVVGRLTRNSDFTAFRHKGMHGLLRFVWLQDHRGGLTGSLFMEFSIRAWGGVLTRV